MKQRRESPVKRINPSGKIVVVHIRRGVEPAVALVDEADYFELVQYRWFMQNGYACRQEQRGGKNRKYYMHREILGLTREQPRREVDHINRDKLDNRRANLRVVSHEWNATNQPARGTFRGVSWDEARGRWIAQASLRGRSFHLGRFESEELAAAVVIGFWRGVDAMFQTEASDAAA